MFCYYQLYLIKSILSVFGVDVKPLISVLATFAEKQRIQQLKQALKDVKFPSDKVFSFNNSVFVDDDDVDDYEAFDELNWQMSTKSFEHFLGV